MAIYTQSYPQLYRLVCTKKIGLRCDMAVEGTMLAFLLLFRIYAPELADTPVFLCEDGECISCLARGANHQLFCLAGGDGALEGSDPSYVQGVLIMPPLRFVVPPWQDSNESFSFDGRCFHHCWWDVILEQCLCEKFCVVEERICLKERGGGLGSSPLASHLPIISRMSSETP